MPTSHHIMSFHLTSLQFISPNFTSKVNVQGHDFNAMNKSDKFSLCEWSHYLSDYHPTSMLLTSVYLFVTFENYRFRKYVGCLVCLSVCLFVCVFLDLLLDDSTDFAQISYTGRSQSNWDTHQIWAKSVHYQGQEKLLKFAKIPYYFTIAVTHIWRYCSNVIISNARNSITNRPFSFKLC